MSEQDKPSLTDKQRRFVDEYCVDWNATQAAIRAGYSERTAGSIGTENLQKPAISEAIDERLRKLSMSAGEALKRLTDWGRADIGELIEVREDGSWSLDLETARKNGKLHLIREISYDADGRPTVKLHDAKDAVKQLAKAHGLFIDRIDVTTDGKPLFKSYQGVDVDEV